MIKTLPLREAVAQVFGLDLKEVPDFQDVKPVKELRGWLDRQNIKYSHERGKLADGIVVFTIGAGSPQYTIVEGDTSHLRGAMIFASITPDVKAKPRINTAPEVDENGQDITQVQGDDVESAPVITNSAQDEADGEMTVTDPKPRKRYTRRKK